MIKPDVNEKAKYYEGIFKDASQGIIFVDHEGIILRVNPAFEKILGYKEHEVLGKSFFALAYRNQKMMQITSHNPLRRFNQAEKGNMEMTLLDKEGHNIPVRFQAVLIRDEHNQVKQAIGIIEHMVEVTETDETGDGLAEKMWEAQQNFDNILNNSADAILICDITGNIMTVNKAFLQMLDYRQEEVIGKHIVEITAAEEGTFVTTMGDEIIIDREYINNTGQKSVELYEKGYVKNWETHFVRKDKVIVPIEATLSVLNDKNGDRRGSIVISRDITERRSTEIDNERTRNFLENIFKTTIEGIFVTDNEGVITMANESLEKSLSYSKGELIGKITTILRPDGKKHYEIAEEFLTILFEKGAVTSFECDYLKKDGSIIAAEVNSALLKDEKGNVTGSVASIRDITERKELENKMLQSEKLKSLGELSGGVAHDFNNVLAAILGRVQLLKMQFKPPPGKQEKRKSMLDLIKSLGIIERASLDGAETVRRIQEFSRKRVDDKDFARIDINELIDDALEFTSVRWKNDAESKGITIVIQKEFSALPPTSGSASELREVFTNLINNAIDAMPKGGRIKVKTFKENGHISISIKDTGVGISEAIRNRIFDPFFTTKGVQSTGLGMSVSYGIINRHGGTIRVNSTEGKGSTFVIKIPISDNVRMKEEEKTNPMPEEKRKSTILVIEDEEEVRNLLADILIENGHQVETASDGNRGIEMFRKKDFDLVFTDLGMPEMSGWQVAETIKTINDKIPVAVITGWNVELEDTEMQARGVNLVAHKPFQVNQILQLVLEGMEWKKRFEAA